MNEHSALICPLFHQAAELIGRRWTGAILQSMQTGASHFSEIARTIPGLSDRLLSQRLKELECQGIVVREVYPETPVRIEYFLTEKGRALEPVLNEIGIWAEKWGRTTSGNLVNDCDNDRVSEQSSSESTTS